MNDASGCVKLNAEVGRQLDRGRHQHAGGVEGELAQLPDAVLTEVDLVGAHGDERAAVREPAAGSALRPAKRSVIASRAALYSSKPAGSGAQRVPGVGPAEHVGRRCRRQLVLEDQRRLQRERLAVGRRIEAEHEPPLTRVALGQVAQVDAVDDRQQPQQRGCERSSFPSPVRGQGSRMRNCMPGRGSTVKPLMVWVLVNDVSICSTMAGASPASAPSPPSGA